MFAVIFEVQPRQGRFDNYLALAKELKPKLEAIDGFIDNERFRSLRDERRLLSLSIWRDEKALIRWRAQGDHHDVQEKGRFEVFEDYHLRVGEIFADSKVPPAAQQRFDETEVGESKAVSVIEVEPNGKVDVSAEALAAQLGLASGDKAVIGHETFESIYVLGKLLLLVSWRGAADAEAFSPTWPPGAKTLRHRSVRIIRDYGMFERREAPQFYPEAQRTSRP